MIAQALGMARQIEAGAKGEARIAALDDRREVEERELGHGLPNIGVRAWNVSRASGARFFLPRMTPIHTDVFGGGRRPNGACGAVVSRGAPGPICAHLCQSVDKLFLASSLIGCIKFADGDH